MSGHRWVGRLGLVPAGLALGLVGAEGALRLAAPTPAEELLAEPQRDATPGLYQRDPVVGQVPVPGFDGRWASAGGSVRVRITAEGYRAPAADGPVAWIAVGDSFTLAAQVDEPHPFAAQLARRLGRPVVNGGVDGYSTFQSVFRYEDLEQAVGGTEGVLYTLFIGNDLSDNETWPQIRVGGLPPGVRMARPPRPEFFPPEVIGVARSQSWLDGLRARSLVLAAWRVTANRRRLEAGDDGWIAHYRRELRPFTTQGQSDRDNLLRTAEAALGQLRDAAGSRGDRLLVALAPPAWGLDPQLAQATAAALGLGQVALEPDAVTDAVVRILDRLGVPSCDLRGPLRAAIERGERPYLRYDGHFSEHGHAVVAEALEACVRGMAGGGP